MIDLTRRLEISAFSSRRRTVSDTASRSPMEPIRQQDQQQKDFLASLFPEFSADPHRTTQEAQNSAMMQGQRHPNNFPVSANMSFNPPLDLLAMSNGMSLQGLDPSHQNLPSTSTFTPQILLEQQYKLTQLHQLQQLQNQIQNQIFQQQASHFLISHDPLSLYGHS